MKKAKKGHVGTFGGTPAGRYLDNLLCDAKNEYLLSRIGSIIGRWQDKAKKIADGTTDEQLAHEVLVIFKKQAFEQVDRILKEMPEKYGVRPSDAILICSLTKNVMTYICKTYDARWIERKKP